MTPWKPQRLLLVLAFTLSITGPGAAEPSHGLASGRAHYFSDFDPAAVPWQPGDPMNYEEVFKNYEYYEIRVAEDGVTIEVRHEVRNRATEISLYRVARNGALRPANAPLEEPGLQAGHCGGCWRLRHES